MIAIKINLYRLFLFLILLFFFLPSFSQGGPPPWAGPPTLEVTSTGSLLFGKFSKVNGGSIEMDFNGNVTSYGDILLINSIRTSVTFEVSSNKNNRTVIVDAPPTELSGPGGSVLELIPDLDKKIFSIDKGNSVPVKMGGTLTIGPEDSSGYYTGTVTVIFAYQ